MLLTILLQIVAGDTTTTDTSGTVSKQVEISLFDLIIQGGWVMLPISLLLFSAIYLFIERYLTIKGASRLDADFLNRLRDKLRDEDIKGALDVCQSFKFPIARMLEKGLSRLGSPIRDVESAIENTARVEIYKMEKNLSFISAIAAIAPVFGFLGTVMGLLQLFQDLAVAENLSLGVITRGIYTKMITSASGLIVGLIAYMFYTYLNNMIERNTHKMEVTAIEFMDILYKPVSVRK